MPKSVAGDPGGPYLRVDAGIWPVIEQAKGILIAQFGCTPDEAFDLLRRASQHANVKAHVLAEHLIERTVSSGPLPPDDA